MMYAVDASVAVPLVMSRHASHQAVSRWARGKTLRLAGHALAETYAVITRLPGDSRLTPADAVAVIDSNFGDPAVLSPGTAVHQRLAEHGIAGGATYDGLVALAAQQNGLILATRDARARSTYLAIGVDLEIVPSAPGD